MKQILLVLLCCVAFVTANAQTKINAVKLIQPGANSTVLSTNASGAVEWGPISGLFTEGVAIDITGTTIGVDPTGLTDIGTPPNLADYIMLYDVTGNELVRVDVDNLLQAHTITISDGTNTQQLKNGNTFLFNSTGTDGYDFLVSATDRVGFVYDFAEYSNLASIDNATDRLQILDVSTGNYFYITPSQLTGTPYSFTISDGTNNQLIDNGQTLLFEDAANGIDAIVAATDKVTFDLDVNELTTDATPDFSADYVPTYDASAGAERKVLLSNLTGGAENNVSIASNTAANANIASGLTLASYRYVQVFLDGVKQRQTTDWIISTNNIQFTFPTLAGQNMTVVGFK